MAVRTEETVRVSVNGVPYLVTLIDSPTIDDVVVTEARIYASQLANQVEPAARRVDRGVRDFLVRLGVER